jgi:YidC/Oxa1 family membrane protein insertase
MNTELRFLTAIILMVGVMIVTNILFPPISEPPAGSPADSAGAPPPAGDVSPGLPADLAGPPVIAPPVGPPGDSGSTTVVETERDVVVESELYRHRFSTRGARLVSAELPALRSFTREGPAQLIPDGTGALGLRLVVGNDTLDLRNAMFTPSSERVDVSGAASQELTFRHERPGLVVQVTYRFRADTYLIDAVGSVQGLERALVVTDLGTGLELNDADEAAERRALAYVANHLQDGIDSYPLRNVDEAGVRQGPFLWAAFKSKFFVLAMMPGAEATPADYLGGVLVAPVDEDHAEVAVATPVGGDGRFGYRAYVGPQEYSRLTALGNDLHEVNPVGWRIFRPIIRPFVGVITWVLMFLHNSLNLTYGWVLVVFGVLMRLLLWPFNQKAMRAQITNMAVQPLLKEIQTKYKDNPEKLQKEMLKLYKEHGFNPFAGCLPMLLPMPILFALFFVFQGTIEFRGAPFLWLPDLSAPDPYYILPLILGVSMFFIMWISMRSAPENPQTKMMMWVMPIMMTVFFFKLAAGLNLYYSVSNLVTIPQQHWIAKERARAQARGPVKLKPS